VDKAALERFLTSEAPFLQALGIVCEDVKPGYALARWKTDARWLRPGGLVFGGGLMTLADAALYMAILGSLGPGALAVTSELKMNFLRPATGGDVIATARVLRMGKRIAYGEVHLAVAEHPERLIAHATSSYALLSSLGGEREKGDEA
jgi:uncharacterized protein (TIGR00369 family)